MVLRGAGRGTLISMPQIVIVGAGALGCAYGQKLLEHHGSQNVAFLAEGERFERLRSAKVAVNGKELRMPVLGPREWSSGDLRPPELILLSVKYHHLEAARNLMAAVAGEKTQILSILNGIDSEEYLAATFGWDRVLYGMALGIDAVRIGYETTYKGLGRIFLGEATNAPPSPRVAAANALLTDAGITTVVPEDMLHALWFKFMVNVGINQVSAILGAPYGDFQTMEEPRRIMDAAIAEVRALSKGVGHPLTDEDVARWHEVMMGLDPDGKTSMLQDVEAQRKTEVEMFAGVVSRLGKRHGVPTPTNDILLELLHYRERMYVAL